MGAVRSTPLGDLLREWRQRRRLSQLELAGNAEISARHLSFLETGRSSPSREMILRLAGQLRVPLREQNVLLVAGGFAPVFPETPLDAPALRAAREAIDRVLTGHEPSPAMAIDRYWTLVASNRTVPRLLAEVDAALLKPPINVLRLTLHPSGLAPRIANLAQWRAHLLERVDRQVELSADRTLMALAKELRDYPGASRASEKSVDGSRDAARVGVPLELIVEGGLLSFFSTTTVFGTPIDITLSELAVESFYPSNAATAAALARLTGVS